MADGASNTLHVAVGVVWRDGRVLIARRPQSAHQGGLLEFPGGKVEPGEGVQCALARELLEETGITVSPQALEPLIGIRHDYGDKQVFLDVWQAHQSIGEPRGLEGQPVFWRAPQDLDASDFPAANRAIINAIRLPQRLAISGDMESPDEVVTHLGACAGRHQPELVVLRLPSLTAQQYTGVVRQSLDRVATTALMVHDRPELVAELPVAGVHLSWRRAASLTERPVAGNRWLGVSCHSQDELTHAAAIGADYATLGPVLPTPSHPGVQGMGWDRFTELAGQAVLPVYALGGIGPDMLAQAMACGAQGIAGISWWWHTHKAETL